MVAEQWSLERSSGWAPSNNNKQASAGKVSINKQQTAATMAQEQVRTMHQYKFHPPTYDGNYPQCEDWKYQFTAYAGLINAAFPRLLAQAEASQQAITDQLLIDGAATPAEGQLWTRLSAELQFILVTTTKAAAATVCRQMGINAKGFETWRQIHRRFSIPVWARSIGYLTKLLKACFEEHRFEEAFASWEFEVNRHERENTATILDSIKIVILLNETKGALQQHLQLTASSTRGCNTVREITKGLQHHPQGCNIYKALTPTLQTIRQHHEVQHQWTSAQLKERRAIRKEQESIKQKDTTAPTTTKEKETEDIPSAKGIHFNKEIHSNEHQKGTGRTHRTSTWKEKENQKEKAHVTNVGSKATSQRTVALQCAMSTRMSINSGRMIQCMAGIKTSGNKSMIKDGTTRIGHNKDMTKYINNKHRRRHHHQHQLHHQAWHCPSVLWRTST